MTVDQNTTAYVYENVGVTTTPVDETSLYAYENVGVTTIVEDGTSAYAYEDVVAGASHRRRAAMVVTRRRVT